MANIFIEPTAAGLTITKGLVRGTGLVYGTGLEAGTGLVDGRVSGIAFNGKGGLSANTIQHGQSKAGFAGNGAISLSTIQHMLDKSNFVGAGGLSNLVGLNLMASVNFAGGQPPLLNPASLITGAGGFYTTTVGVTGNPNVTAWADQSSFGQNLTGHNSPQYSATGFNSAYPGITFAGGSSQYFLDGTFAFSNSTCSVFMLFYWTVASASSFEGVVTYTANGSSDASSAPNFYFGSNGTAIQQYSDNNGDIALGPVLTQNVPVLTGFVIDGANNTVWTNGVAGTPTADTNLIGGNGNTNFSIGGRLNGSSTATNYASMTLAFVGITQKVLLQADWTNLKNYCNSAWGTSF
jgi:hypothetical protein